MVEVGQQAGGRVSGFHDDRNGFGQPGQVFRETPDFGHRRDPLLQTDFDRCAVPFRHDTQVQNRVLGLMGTDGRSSHTGPTEGLDHLCITFEFFEPCLALDFVIHDPSGKTDGTLDGQVSILELFAKIGEFAATLDKGPQISNPWLNPFVSRLNRDGNLLIDGQFLGAIGVSGAKSAPSLASAKSTSLSKPLALSKRKVR